MLVETGLNNYENLFRIKSDGRLLGRVLHRVRHVEDPRRALLPLDRRVPAVGNPQDPEAAAGAAADGAAADGRVWPAAILGAGGGRPVTGHGEAAAERHGDPDSGRPVRFIRGLPAADGQRHGQAERARCIRHPGGQSPAHGAASDAQDPDDAAGGEGPPRARRLLPAPLCAEPPVGTSLA